MTALLWLIAAIFFTAAGGFYSGSEMGLYCVNRVRLRLRAEQTDARDARRLSRLVHRQQETVLGILLGTNLANYLLTVATATLLAGAAGIQPHHVEFYTAAILSPLIFVIGDVVPKNCYQIKADRLMYRSALPLRATVLFFRATGVLWLLHGVTRLGARLAGHDEREEWREPRAEVVGLLREGAAEGALTEDQARIVERVMRLSTVRVGTIMVPRRHVAAVPVDADRGRFEQIVRGHNYSRMPVLARDRRSIVGIVNVYDVLADETDTGVETRMHTPVTIHARDSAASALVQLRRAPATMAIVTDPRRGFVGIVTLKDVIEEIFGELPAW